MLCPVGPSRSLSSRSLLSQLRLPVAQVKPCCQPRVGSPWATHTLPFYQVGRAELSAARPNIAGAVAAHSTTPASHSSGPNKDKGQGRSFYDLLVDAVLPRFLASVLLFGLAYFVVTPYQNSIRLVQYRQHRVIAIIDALSSSEVPKMLRQADDLRSFYHMFHGHSFSKSVGVKDPRQRWREDALLMARY